MFNLKELMEELNPAQRQAVQHPPQIPLQILAGPGSGKTKVLTMRIAYLITHCHLPPWSLCAVTFTNKAANEMRERLIKLIGKDSTAQIKMGTFHAMCAMFLRRYSRVVGIEGNFTVCDADESKKIIAKLLKPHKDVFADRNISLKEHGILGLISQAKAKGWTADDALRHVEEANTMTPQQRLARVWENKRKDNAWEGELGLRLAAIYKEYEKTLRDTNSLDFDDLLMFGVQLFGKHAKASSWCRHVLVDEYQDTNTMQYELMVHIARASQCVTVVGDPDQSIYGWRSAEIENLAKMQRDFPATQQLYLEQNYRSTGSILDVSVAIVSQDKGRIQKTLHTSHPKGPLPVLRDFPTEQVEAAFVASEIKRLVAYSGGMFNWGDFVILLRYNSLSRGIESALQKEGIPNRVLAGQKFFERMEIKDVLAYLQLVDNPRFVPAFMRVVNIPPRAVGEKTVNEILLRAEELKISPLQVVERIVDGRIPDIKPPAKRKLAPFVETIRILRKHANDGIAPSKLINALVDSINYKEHLARTQPDAESRWDNVQELVNFASEVERGAPEDLARRMFEADEALHERDGEDEDDESQEDWADDLNEFDVDQASGSQAPEDTPLRLFLQASMLSTDTETPEEEKSKEKVTISTCHAAKGLEWPVVMIPAVESGVFPSTRAEDTEEERRLLYVACTRAQGLLYLTHTTARMMSGEYKHQWISPFLGVLHSEKKTKALFTETLPTLPTQDRKTIADVLGRALPDETEVAQRISEYERTARHPAWGENAPFPANYAHNSGEHGVQWQPQRFPSVPYKGPGQQNSGGGSAYQQDIIQPAAGHAAFSSSSSLLTATQRSSVVCTAAPLASSNSQAANGVLSSPPQRRRAGVEDRASKRTSTSIARNQQSSQSLITIEDRPQVQNAIVLRRSSAGSLKEEPIDIDALPSVPTQPRANPLTTKPVPSPSPRTLASRRAVASGSNRPSPAPTARPAPPASLTYRTPPSVVPSLPLPERTSVSAITSLKVVPSAAMEPAAKSAGVKRRLGMGRTVGGYTNKKFKPVTPGAS